MALPKFIGIGSRRCASSWLHKYLNDHPKIGKHRGGLHFFSDNYDKGLDWYNTQFSELDGKNVIIEYSVSYSYPECYQSVSKRIKEYSSEVKLFITVRNPIERAYSDYLRSVRLNEFPPDSTFENVAIANSAILERGKYGKVLEEYMKYFDAERIKVLFYEDLVEDQTKYIDDICSFFGIKSIYPVSEDRGVVNKGRGIKSKNISNLIRSSKEILDTIAHSLGLGIAWSRVKSNNQALYQKVLSLNAKNVEPISQEMRNDLVDYFRDDILLLESLTNRDLGTWLR